jgi:hypothetical protein
VTRDLAKKGKARKGKEAPRADRKRKASPEQQTSARAHGGDKGNKLAAKTHPQKMKVNSGNQTKEKANGRRRGGIQAQVPNTGSMFAHT